MHNPSVVTMAELITWIDMSPPMGLSYLGEWNTTSQLRIITQNTGAVGPWRNQPRVTDLVFQMIGQLRDPAKRSYPVTVGSPIYASGSWGGFRMLLYVHSGALLTCS